MAVGDLSAFLPCTPHGVIELARRSGINLAGAEAVVLGRSKIVGTPVAELLKWHHATVTVCHSKTKNLKEKVCSNNLKVKNNKLIIKFVVQTSRYFGCGYRTS